MNKPPQDFGIPLLTEVIDMPQRSAASEDIPELTTPFASAEDAIPAPAIAEPAAIDGWIGKEWAQLERTINERVLAQILERVDPVLEQGIRDNLADVLQLAVEKLAGEIREGLQQTLEGVIGDAVKQEIEQLKYSKK